MNFQRQFKFYASHRNQLLLDKCACLHGHRYEVTYYLEMNRSRTSGNSGDVTVLFSDLDFIDSSIRKHFDHACLLDVSDPVGRVLIDFAKFDPSGPFWKFVITRFPTSAENLAFVMFDSILSLIKKSGLDVLLKSIQIRETDSTLVSYNHDDWMDDWAYLQSFSTIPYRSRNLYLAPSLSNLQNMVQYLTENQFSAESFLTT